MPQGGIDPGETLHQALARELQEEVGVTSIEIVAGTSSWHHYDFPLDLADSPWRSSYRGQAQKWFLVRFLGKDTEISVAADVPEFSAWRWCPPLQAITNVVPFKREVYVAAFQELWPKVGSDRPLDLP